MTCYSEIIYLCPLLTTNLVSYFASLNATKLTVVLLNDSGCTSIRPNLRSTSKKIYTLNNSTIWPSPYVCLAATRSEIDTVGSSCWYFVLFSILIVLQQGKWTRRCDTLFIVFDFITARRWLKSKFFCSWKISLGVSFKMVSNKRWLVWSVVEFGKVPSCKEDENAVAAVGFYLICSERIAHSIWYFSKKHKYFNAFAAMLTK